METFWDYNLFLKALNAIYSSEEKDLNEKNI